MNNSIEKEKAVPSVSTDLGQLLIVYVQTNALQDTLYVPLGRVTLPPEGC